MNENKDNQEISEEMPEEIKELIAERQAIADKVDTVKISDSVLTMIQRAEMHSILKKEDFYITTVENGIAFFNEESYTKLVEKTISDLRTFLDGKNLPKEEVEVEVDKYAANLVIHYVDYKLFTDEQKDKVYKKFGVTNEQD